jgi:hypothetical protein
VTSDFNTVLSANAFGRSTYELFEYAGAASDELFEGSGPG